MSAITKAEIDGRVAALGAMLGRPGLGDEWAARSCIVTTIQVLEHLSRDMDRRAHPGRERQPNERSLEASAWEIFVAQVASGCNGIGDHLYPGVQKDLARNAFVLALAFREVAAEQRRATP